MTYEAILHAITEGKPLRMRPRNPTLPDTAYAQHVIEAYRKGETVPWHEDAPAEEIAFHLWNAWHAQKLGTRNH
jgi:hypothetical protein